MPNENLELIRHSFPLIFQHKAEITTKFYEGLFRDAPELRRLFSKEMNVQKDMLVSVLTTLAKASFDEGLVESMIARMARVHSGLGITSGQFRTGEAALLSALDQSVGDLLSETTLDAWKTAVRRVISAMIDPPTVEA
ncbi:globin domain-containing protein [Thalassobius sp. S69A]|uniref:globin domain-containing protein n=1 Tax=unclassified Thalassovita TaxID=2619711 RepID=UPI003C799F50